MRIKFFPFSRRSQIIFVHGFTLNVTAT